MVITGELFVFARDCTPDYPKSDAAAYCRSKLGNIWFAHELQRREPDLIVPMVHPGAMSTDFHGPG